MLKFNPHLPRRSLSLLKVRLLHYLSHSTQAGAERIQYTDIFTFACMYLSGA